MGWVVFNLDDKLELNTAKQLCPLNLAFIGDAVHTLFVRQQMQYSSDDRVCDLNAKVAKVVCAKNQAELIDLLMPILTEEEIAIFKRGRNTKKGTRAKNATVQEYNKSTGFECLIGFLYLTGQTDRLNYLLNFKENL